MHSSFPFPTSITIFLWLTTWYKRNEIATRQCYMSISAAISGVVGGLIAGGFIKMDGLRGWPVGR
jgi:hypothetical protein